MSIRQKYECNIRCILKEKSKYIEERINFRFVELKINFWINRYRVMNWIFARIRHTPMSDCYLLNYEFKKKLVIF